MTRPRLIHWLIAVALLGMYAAPYNRDPEPPHVLELADQSTQGAAQGIGLPHIAFTYDHDGQYGIFISNSGCCSIKAQVIVYRNPTTVAGALYWGPCANPIFPELLCNYSATAGLYKLRSVLSASASDLATTERYCFQHACIRFHPRSEWVDAQYDREADLREAMVGADMPYFWHYCLALTLPNTNWTYVKRGRDGCRRGY